VRGARVDCHWLWLCRVKALRDARLKYKAGKHLTPDAREALDLTLTPVQEKLLEP